MSSLTGAPSSLLSLSWPLFLVLQDSDPTRPFEGIAALLCALKIPHRPFLQQCPDFLPPASTLQAPQADCGLLVSVSQHHAQDLAPREA